MTFARLEDIVCKQHTRELRGTNMQTSAEFEKLTTRFFQDIDSVVSSQDDMYKFVLSPFKSEKERERLRAFLDAVTQDDVSDTELQKIWWSSSADMVFHDSVELRAMLRELRDRL